MNLRQIEAFRAVMRLGSVTAAAKVLHVSQPSISRQLSDLERSVGLRLFEHKKGVVRPTAEAQSLVSEVERCFVGVEEIRRAAEIIRRSVSGEVRVGTCPSIMFEVFPRTISVLQSSSPTLFVLIQNLESEQILQGVRSGQLDVGIVATVEKLSDVALVRKTDVQYVVLLRSDHPLAQRNVISIEDLRGFPFVSPERSWLRRWPAGRKLVEELRPVTRVETYASYSACLCAMLSPYTAIVDPFTASFFARTASMVVRPLDFRLTYEVALIRPVDATSSAAVSRFLTQFEEDLSQSVKELSRRESAPR